MNLDESPKPRLISQIHNPLNFKSILKKEAQFNSEAWNQKKIYKFQKLTNNNKNINF